MLVSVPSRARWASSRSGGSWMPTRLRRRVPVVPDIAAPDDAVAHAPNREAAAATASDVRNVRRCMDGGASLGGPVGPTGTNDTLGSRRVEGARLTVPSLDEDMCRALAGDVA